MPGKYDSLWKGMLEEVFDDLLRFAFPTAETELDLEKGFHFLDKEMGEMYPEPENPSNTRYVDKLTKVYLRSGFERWILVHVEVQGWHDPEFPKRMFTYYYRILDRFGHPVTAIAILTGADGKRMRNRYEDHCLGTYQIYQYNTICIMDYSDEELGISDNPFAQVMLVAKKGLLNGKSLDSFLLEEKLQLVRLLIKKGLFTKRKIGAILTFLNNYVLFEKPETNRIFMEKVDQIIGKQNTMGIFEQLAEIKAEEAKQKGDEKAVRLLLNNTEFSPEKIATLVGVSLSFVEKVKEG